MAFNGFLNIALLQQLLHLNERNGENVNRRILRDSGDPFQLADISFIKYFRLSKNMTRYLIIQLRPHLQHQRSTSISVEIKVLTALLFFGHGSYQKCIGQNLNTAVEQSVVSRIIANVTDVITEHLLDQYIVFPQTDIERNIIKEGFNAKYNFPGVIGAIDCTHVAIVAPPTEDVLRPGLAYYNRKGFYSINVQMICDANLKILGCNARFPGSTHDSAIWHLCTVKRYLQEKYLLGELHSTWLLGDFGYPLQPWLLTPIADAAENTPEDRYNTAHISTRNCIERCFVLKQRFRCLLKHRTLHYDPMRAAKIIYSCAVLHNIAVEHGLPDIYDDDNDSIQDLYNLEIERDQQQGRNENWLAEGRRVRNTMIRQVFRNV